MEAHNLSVRYIKYKQLFSRSSISKKNIKKSQKKDKNCYIKIEAFLVSTMASARKPSQMSWRRSQCQLALAAASLA